MNCRLASLAPALVVIGSFALALGPCPAQAQSDQRAPATRPVEARPVAAAAAQPASPGKPPEISFEVHKVLETPAEGPDVERTYFLVGSKRVAFAVPRDCHFQSSDGFALTPDGDSDAEIHVTRSPLTLDANFATEAVRYHEVAAAGLPPGVEGEKPAAPVMDTYPFNGWKSMEFTWSYSLYGRSVVRSVTFINLESGVQVMVTTVAAKNEAAKIEKLARQFLSSWWVMKGS